MTQHSSRHFASTVLAIAVLLTGMGAITTAVWVAFQLALDPDALVWLNQYLPERAQLTTKGRQAYKTLAEIQTSIAQTGAIPQEAIALPSPSQDLLIPLLQKRPGCQVKCEFLSEIRIYRPVESFKALAYSKTQTYYQLVSQLTVKPLEESFVLAAQIAASDEPALTNRPLSLATVELANPDAQTLSPELKPGVWLNLTGRVATADRTTLYGKLLYYNPSQVHLVEMLDWTSPQGEPPVWQNLNADRTPELVINQTFNFEPQFKLYQLKPRPFVPAPVDLEEVTLATPALDTPNYEKALILARSGLWSSAARLIQPLTQSQDWSIAAQAQLDLIELHAQTSKTQADQVWAAPGQQVLAEIIDGRWSEALKVFQVSLNHRREIVNLLKSDSGVLQRRVDAALRVDSQQEAVRVWGALLQASQQGKADAIAWVKTLPPIKTPQLSLERFLTQLEIAVSNRDPDLSRVIGFVEIPNRPPQASEWQFPASRGPLNLNTGQIWYEIEVTGFAEGNRWTFAPFNLNVTPTQLWQQLNLDLDPQMQVITAQQPLSVTVQGLQWRAGKLRLLAAADETELLPTAFPSSLPDLPGKLAVTSGTLQWLQPEIIQFSKLRELRPAWVEKVAPTLAQILQFPPDSILPFDFELIQVIDLTGDRQPEFFFTIPAALTPRLLNPRTLIFNDQGELIYANDSPDQGYIRAIVDFNDQGLPGLMIDHGQGYRFLRWSSNNRKFD